MPRWPASVMDLALAAHFEYLYEVGHHHGIASSTLCGAVWLSPHLAGTCRAIFPAADKSARGWKKQQPSAHRPPIPKIVALSIAHELVLMNRLECALLVWLLFESYLRVEECLQLHAKQIVPGIRGSRGLTRFTTLLSSDATLGQTAKNAEVNHSVPLDLHCQKPLAETLERLAALKNPLQRMWCTSYQQLANAFQQACKNLKIKPGQYCLHCLRHGGASEDRAAGHRSLTSVMGRGNWKALTSVRRYDKSALLARELNLWTPVQRQALASRSEKFVTDSKTIFAKLL